MVFLQPQLGQLLLLMCLGGLLQTDICKGQHLVHIQEGPLYRVKGYPISISCNVSGLKFVTQQTFSFSVTKPENPTSSLRIISTDDPGYAYAVFAQRVREKEIVIKRLSDISAIFQMMSLRAEDAGIYECYTPNKESVYYGTYNAETELIVIEDTLEASYSGPEFHSITEGDNLQLECQVSSQTFQHTHLSVTWYLRGTAETWPIIALDRDLTIRPGQPFEKRYLSGLIVMEKVEDTTYRLKMSQVQQSDSGEIYCQAEEWIQDPDRSWIRISHKNTTSSKIEVKRIEISEVGSFISQIKTLNGSLQEGDMMEIHCSIKAQNLLGRFFSMTWLKDNMEVAHVDPSGVLSVYKNFMKREKEGELKAVKKDDKTYVFTIQPVRLEDQGRYQCKASQEERTNTGTFNRGQSQLSQEETVHIKSKESSLAVVMAKQLVQVTEGETLQISCSVTGATGLLSTSWHHKKSTSSSFSEIITLSREGVMEAVGAQYQHRGVRTFRPTAAEFVLELSGAVMSDGGEYTCTVSQWNMESNGNMKKVNSQSQRGDFAVQSIDSLVTAVLRSRETKVTENSVIKMICSVTAPNVPLAVMWKFTPFNSTSHKDIMFMRHTGDISYGKEQRNYQLETTVQKSGKTFILRVLKASKRHQGLYQCQIDAYERDVQKAKKLSNPLAVTVNRPASKLSLHKSTASPLQIPENTNEKLDCLVTSTTFNSSRFEVTWRKDSQILIRMELEGVVSLGPETHLEMDERIKLRRTERQNFQLTIQQVKTMDSGQYVCSVQEWIQDPDGIWYNLDTKSITVELAVIKKEVSEVGSFISLIKTLNGSLQEGDMMEIHCSIKAQNLLGRFFSMTWLKDNMEVTHVDPSGVLSVYKNFMKREKEGELKAVKKDDKTYVFTIQPVRLEDQGRYQCKASQEERTDTGTFNRGQSQLSQEETVHIKSKESSLAVVMVRQLVQVTEGETLQISCSVTGATGLLSTSWHHKKSTSSSFSEIITLSREGVMEAVGAQYQHRGVRTFRPTAAEFVLELSGAVMSDGGEYTCTVSQWNMESNGNMKKVNSQSQRGDFAVQSIESNLQVHKVNSMVSVTDVKTGFTVECEISSYSNNKSVFEVTWFKKEKEKQPMAIFTAHRDGTTHKMIHNRTLVYNQPNAKLFTLTVPDVTSDDDGQYQCQVVEWLNTASNSWKKLAEDSSGELSVQVQPEVGKAECSSGIILSSFIPLLCLLLLIIAILLKTMWTTKSKSRKQTHSSLWAENNPLKPIQEVTAGEKDSVLS